MPLQCKMHIFSLCVYMYIFRFIYLFIKSMNDEIQNFLSNTAVQQCY